MVKIEESVLGCESPHHRPELVEKLARRIFGENLSYIHTLDRLPAGFFLGIKDNKDSSIVDIYLTTNSMVIFDPSYIEEAVRFARAYEQAFLSSGQEVNLKRDYTTRSNLSR